MIRRVGWMVVGASVGALAALYALAGIRRARTVLDPQTVPGRVAGRAQAARSRVQAAVDDGRRARHEYEERARRRHQARRPASGARAVHADR